MGTASVLSFRNIVDGLIEKTFMDGKNREEEYIQYYLDDTHGFRTELKSLDGSFTGLLTDGGDLALIRERVSTTIEILHKEVHKYKEKGAQIPENLFTVEQQDFLRAVWHCFFNEKKQQQKK